MQEQIAPKIVTLTLADVLLVAAAAALVAGVMSFIFLTT